MDLDITAIGEWAADKGPYLFVIAILSRMVLKMQDRFSAQQEVVLEMMRSQDRAVTVLERQQEEA